MLDKYITIVFLPLINYHLLLKHPILPYFLQHRPNCILLLSIQVVRCYKYWKDPSFLWKMLLLLLVLDQSWLYYILSLLYCDQEYFFLSIYRLPWAGSMILRRHVNKVDLPAPVLPTIPTFSPCLMSILTFFKTKGRSFLYLAE